MCVVLLEVRVLLGQMFYRPSKTLAMCEYLTSFEYAYIPAIFPSPEQSYLLPLNSPSSVLSRWTVRMHSTPYVTPPFIQTYVFYTTLTLTLAFAQLFNTVSYHTLPGSMLG